MPIFKIPVSHDLGILSPTCQENLKKRIEKAQDIKTAKNAAAVTRNPFEILEQFLQSYCHANGSEKGDKYAGIAKQFLSRSKRRAGLQSMGEGHYVDLPLAWIELLMLGLCPGKIQNDSLNALLRSMDQAPVETDQIPMLFDLAASVFHWMSTETSQKSDSHTYDAKILKLGYLVSLRLFLFHILGDLGGFQQSKVRLHNLLKGLSQCETWYQPYPSLLFAIHFMLRVGEIICGLKTINNDPVKVQANADKYEMNQMLWNCLFSWHCVQKSIGHLPQVAKHLIQLRHELQQDNWVECGLGLMVLGEAAKSNMLCLQVLLKLRMDPKQERHDKLEYTYCMVLADICQNSSYSELQRAALVGAPSNTVLIDSGGLLSLLKQSDALSRECLRYSVLQALVHVCGSGVTQEGLRNTAWLALHEHLDRETDQRAVDLVRVTEAEFSVSERTLRSEETKSLITLSHACTSPQLITWRMAHTLCQLCVAPAPRPLLPGSSQGRPRRGAASLPPPGRMRPSPSRPSTKTPANKPQSSAADRVHGSHAFRRCEKQQASGDSNTRNDNELRKALEDQWLKELKMKMAKEKEIEKEEMARKMKEEEERFKEIMRRRKEKLRRDTKPYELPGR